MQIQRLKTSKLFYNKWPYKIECYLAGANKITNLGLDRAKKWCQGTYSLSQNAWLADGLFNGQRPFDKKTLLHFISNIEPFLKLKDDLQIRAEGGRFNIFCKDIILLNNIHNALMPWVTSVYGPTSTEEYEFLMANGHKKILCDQLPKDKFQYRIYLKEEWARDNRKNFLDWANNYPAEINIAQSTFRWLEGSKNWVNSPFMYITDSKTLVMVGLHTSGYVKKIEEFVPRHMIPTA